MRTGGVSYNKTHTLHCLNENNLSFFFSKSLCTDVHLPQCDNHSPGELYPVHHAWQFCPALAGDPLQHVHLHVPLPPAVSPHDFLLHTNPGGDIQPHGSEQQ